MVQKTDVLVIGGGAIGTAAAYYLQAAGRQVTVLDSGALGGGCSEKNAGLIVPSHVVPLAAPGVISQGMRWMLDSSSPFYIRPRLNWELLRWLMAFRAACSQRRMEAALPVLHGLLQSSLKAFGKLSETLDLGMQKQGMLITWNKEKGEKDCLSTGKSARQVGLEVETLDSASLRRLEPNVHSGAKGGIFFPQDAHLDPAHMMNTLRKAAEATGAVFLANTPVTGAKRAGNKLTSITTNNGDWQAREVVLCGGAWSPNLLPGVTLPVQAGKGYSVTLPARGRIPKISQILAEAKVSITPLGDKIRFGGTLELGGLDATINRKRASSLLAQAADFLDDFNAEDVPTSAIWSGFRPCSPDGLPIIGRYPELDNLIVATGHAMVGISLAPISGQLVTSLAQGSQPVLDLAPLSPRRFL